MRLNKLVAALMLAASVLVLPGTDANAAINSMNLGAKYDGTKANINFKIYSSRATRIELSVYASAYGGQEVAKFVLAKDASNVWSTSAVVSSLQTLGVSGPVYYGYRAWGPNWP